MEASRSPYSCDPTGICREPADLRQGIVSLQRHLGLTLVELGSILGADRHILAAAEIPDRRLCKGLEARVVPEFLSSMKAPKEPHLAKQVCVSTRSRSKTFGNQVSNKAPSICTTSQSKIRSGAALEYLSKAKYVTAVASCSVKYPVMPKQIPCFCGADNGDNVLIHAHNSPSPAREGSELPKIPCYFLVFGAECGETS